MPYKAGFGPFAPEVYRAPAPYPYRGITSEDALDGLAKLFKSDVDPKTVACVVLEPVQGEGGFVPMTARLPRPPGARCADRTGSSTSTTRCSPGRGAQARSGRSSTTTAVEPDLLVSGKSIGGGLPLAGVTGRAELMDAVPPGGLGGTFGGNPLSCAAAVAVLEAVREPEFLDARGTARRDASDAARRPRLTSRRDRRGARARADARAGARGADARTARRRPSTRRSSAACSCSRAVCTGTSSGCCLR